MVKYNRSMTYLTIKIIKGNPYLYEVRSERDGDRVRQVFVRYLGRADRADTVERRAVEPKAERVEPTEVPKGIPSKVFYITTTDMPHYDQLLDPTKAEYFAKEKGEKGTIIWVTPDEALAKGAEIHGVSIEEELRIVSEEAISKYTEMMKQGEKFPLPVLDYKRKDQEGRHRILAAKKAGETRIPVLVVEVVEDYPDLKPPITPEVRDLDITFSDRISENIQKELEKVLESIPESIAFKINEIDIDPALLKREGARAIYYPERGAIVIRDAATARNPEVIVHEIAHQVDAEIVDDYSRITKPRTEGARETFAEDFSTYIVNPRLLTEESLKFFNERFPKPTPVTPEVTPPPAEY